jgi:hypothetical protein
MAEGKKPKIRWTAQEWTNLARRVLELRAAHPELPEERALREAQTVLPPERQKSGGNLSTHFKQLIIADGYRAARAAAQATQPPAPAPTPAPTPEPAPEPVTQAADVPPPIPAPAPARRPTLMDLITGQIATHVAAAVKQAIREVVADPEVVALFQHTVLDVLTTPAPPAAAPQEPRDAEGVVQGPRLLEELREPGAPAPHVHVDKPRVMVLGLLGAQATAVGAEFPDMDLRFFGADTQHKRLTEQAGSADYALVMTKFVNHPAEFAVRRAKPDDFRRINGGPSDLISVLRAIRAEWRVRMQKEAEEQLKQK